MFKKTMKRISYKIDIALEIITGKVDVVILMWTIYCRQIIVKITTARKFSKLIC